MLIAAVKVHVFTVFVFSKINKTQKYSKENQQIFRNLFIFLL